MIVVITGGLGLILELEEVVDIVLMFSLNLIQVTLSLSDVD